MTWNEFFGSTVFLGMAIAAALTVFFVLRGPADKLLGTYARLEPARMFYGRVLLVMLLLAATGVAAGKVFALPKDAAFMEYVWQAAGNINSVLSFLAIIVAGYAVVIMVLAVGLGRDK